MEIINYIENLEYASALVAGLFSLQLITEKKEPNDTVVSIVVIASLVNIICVFFVVSLKKM